MQHKHDTFLEARCDEEELQGRNPSVIVLIKQLREHSLMGLKEAKDTVDDFLRRRGNPAESSLSQQANPVSTQRDSVYYNAWLQNYDAQLAAAHQTSDKISLIKALREHANLGLKEAKDIVDSFMQGRPPIASSSPQAVRSDNEVWLREHIAQLEGARQKPDYISLIRDLREHADLGLKEAREIVDDFCIRERPDIHSAADGGIFGSILKMFAGRPK